MATTRVPDDIDLTNVKYSFFQILGEVVIAGGKKCVGKVVSVCIFYMVEFVCNARS